MELLLAQTDTTVGFLSQDAERLAAVKSRTPDKPFLKVYDRFTTFKRHGGRIPQLHKRYVRRARATTFVVKAHASRIVKDPDHLKLLERYGWFYSTSANRSGDAFEPDFCMQNSDIMVQDYRGLHESTPSSIYRLGRKKRKKLR